MVERAYFKKPHLLEAAEEGRARDSQRVYTEWPGARRDACLMATGAGWFNAGLHAVGPWRIAAAIPQAIPHLKSAAEARPHARRTDKGHQGPKTTLASGNWASARYS